MDGVDIATAGVGAVANSIRAKNKSLQGKLSEIRGEIGKLGNSWRSDSSDEFQRRFAQLDERIADYNEVVIGYAAFLDATARNYEATDDLLRAQADRFA